MYMAPLSVKEELMKQMLQMDYEPEQVVDISTLSREQWLAFRRLGIGGSDVAAIMGISPFVTSRDLYYDKIGVTPVIEEPEANWVTGGSGSGDFL